MISLISRWIVVLTVLTLLRALTLPGTARAQVETFTVVQTLPINFVISGCEESIELSGTLHSVSRITIDDSHGFHMVSEINPQGVTGAGLVSGTQYQGVGVMRFNQNGRMAAELTEVNSFKLIGQGPTDNLLVQATFHVTVSANGELTALVNNVFARCHG